MKNLILSILLIFASTTLFAADKNCESALAKLKPSCNFIGAGVDNMKKFSKNNKTIGQSLENTGIIKKDKPIELKKSLKKLAEENKTIDQTIKNINKKNKN